MDRPLVFFKRKWWNWQTRYLEVVVRVKPLGGSSPPFRIIFTSLYDEAWTDVRAFFFQSFGVDLPRY